MTAIYSPVMKLRASEMQALKMLSTPVKENIIPVIQLLPIKDEIEQLKYLSTRVRELLGAFIGSNMKFYADFDLIESDSSSDLSYISKFLSMVSQQQIGFIPVITFVQESPAYLQLIKDNYLHHGICVKPPQYRLRTVAIDIFCNYLNDALSSYMKHFNIDESMVDILLDLNFIDHFDFDPSDDGFTLPERIIQIISGISNKEKFRSIIISGGSFPEDLTGYVQDTETYSARHEWDIWKEIRAALPDLPLRYADYGNIHPTFNPQQESHQGTCSIKYTTEDDFLVYKGRLSNKHEDGHGQYVNKSKALLVNPVYSGPNFSWGDKMINDIANGITPPVKTRKTLTRRTSTRKSSNQTEPKIPTGNAGQWVQFTFNHHMTKITQLMGVSVVEIVVGNSSFQLDLLSR
ncbi:beta family protein [Xanthocytophaga agilis]|uniref:Beta protein n=1 Tax=Xanthocytophaga agilis TaxID=3048010 RepID=A0AAE3RBC7_9BACT|nr:hypothetical protein [Xanthocytophaga agilis]MDJ1504984.1 hypothetical protein [Xanthocytophaga agilis]